MLRRAMTSTVLIVSLVAVAACTVDGTLVPVGADATQQPQVPETAAAAATAPGARTLMARIRAADPCLGLDQTYPRRFGSVVRETQQKAQGSHGLSGGCFQRSGDTAGAVPGDLGYRPGGAGPRRDDHGAGGLAHGLPRASTEPRIQFVRISNPFEDSGFGATVEVTRFIEGRGSDQAAWPQSCASLKEYLGITADKIVALTPRGAVPPPPSLLGRDPRADLVLSAVKANFNGWRILPVAYYPYSCYVTAMRTPTLGVTTRLAFERDAEQVGDSRERDQVAGLPAQFYESTQRCSVVVLFRRATNPAAWDAHNISVELGDPRPGGEPALDLDAADLPDYCAPVRDIATAQVFSLR
ncbi:hypothetical protein Gbro_3440 [Gordonia bronchialis DSM 43247]|uniref:Lipoprotein n=1 Tax=Gordonia bronchialis (strain ATCC 25592 / DSM 43247 / BCRC 13721 / JCM 3198 / KCTC 3076 / NBRC 16047 / NCTC 10667) TaxID=526226 RepID=D0LE43_GORB4|nr:hypothetical protein Gbro_3440 [Gordonia bronchialis DSM 43247]STQ65574.1 Uncharacterised protein [Gordonia bronchialis]